MSSGEDGGLRSPPMLMKLLLLRTGGRDAGAASSTSCRRGLDTLTRLWRYDELLRLIRAGRGPKSVRSVPASVGGRDGESRRAWYDGREVDEDGAATAEGKFMARCSRSGRGDDDCQSDHGKQQGKEQMLDVLAASDGPLHPTRICTPPLRVSWRRS